MDWLTFPARLIAWRGPAPFVFAPVADDLVDTVRAEARIASYGWGCVPVEARIGDTAFTTSLIPREGGYLLPVKVAVQRAEDISVGDDALVQMRVVLR